MALFTIPTTARLPDTLRLEADHPVVVKLLSRLSRGALLALAEQWLSEEDISLTAPYLRRRRRRRQQDREDEEEEEEESDMGSVSDIFDFFPASGSLASLREVYSELKNSRGSKREIVERILTGDWRHGLTLYQLATADMQYLHDRPLSQKWSAHRIVPLKLRAASGNGAGDGDEDGDDVAQEPDKKSLLVPRFHPSTFLRNLQALLPPDIKAHCALERHKELPVLLLRIFIFDSPYNTALAKLNDGDGGGASAANLDASRTVFVAFPDASPHVFISSATQLLPPSGGGGGGGGVSGGGGGGAAAFVPPSRGESTSLRSLVIDGIPSALSRPRERYALRPTSLSTRNMAEMLGRRGAGRTNSAGGGWGVYADLRKKESPLDTVLPTPPMTPEESEEDGDGLGVEGGEEEEEEEERRRKQRQQQQGLKRVLTVEEQRERRAAKRRMLVAKGRFGNSARVDDGLGVERLDVVMQDPFTAVARQEMPPPTDERLGRFDPRGGHGDGRGRRTTLDAAFQREAELREEDGEDDPSSATAEWRPEIKLTFHGTHVFAGIRQLVEAGVIDGERMPGWMTGEEGVTIGAVRNGRIRGHKGSGL